MIGKRNWRGFGYNGVVDETERYNILERVRHPAKDIKYVTWLCIIHDVRRIEILKNWHELTQAEKRWGGLSCETIAFIGHKN